MREGRKTIQKKQKIDEKEKKNTNKIENENTGKKNKKLNILDIITITVVLVLIVMYSPRAWSLYQERKAMLEEAKKEPVIVYPLEVEITEQDTKFFVDFFKDYAIGIRAEINLLDDITQNEMVDFCRAILSEKYSSSGLISKTSMDSAMQKYFELSGVDYNSLGYKSLAVYKEYDAQKVFNVTKLMQLEKDVDLYHVYTDCIDKANIQDGTYKKENIEDVYIFTFKKIVTENQDELGAITTDVKYVIQKVEKEVIVEEPVEEVNIEEKNVKKKK